MRHEQTPKIATTEETTNAVLQEIGRLATEYGYKPTSIASKAFKNSRKAEQLKRRDIGDAEALKKLAELELQLEAERQNRVGKLFPKRDPEQDQLRPSSKSGETA